MLISNRNLKVFRIVTFILWFLLSVYLTHELYIFLYVKPIEVFKMVEKGEKELQTLELEFCSDPGYAAYDPVTCSKYDL